MNTGIPENDYQTFITAQESRENEDERDQNENYILSCQIEEMEHDWLEVIRDIFILKFQNILL